LRVLEALLDVLSARHFVPSPLMSSAATHLDVSHPVVIRASAFS
jgi:hypothetical protein